MTEQNPLAAKSTPAVSVVFKCLYNAKEPITKQEVATKCGLSLPTVYQAFSVLEERSLIDNGQNRSSTGGRRAQTFSISHNSVATIGISLTGHSARCVACNLYGERIEDLYLKQPLDAVRTPTSLAASVHKMVNAMNAKLKQRGIRVEGVGIAVPSAVDPSTGKLLNTSVLRLDGSELYARDLTARLPYPAGVFNDANCGAFSQVFPGAPNKSLAYLSLERGVGGSLIVEGKPFEGPFGTSGEFGHICIEPDGKRCACGREGCLEAYCSSNALSEEIDTTLDEFFTKVKQDDEQACAILHDYIAYLARGIQTIHTMLGVHVCLGGELAGYLAPYFFQINAAVEALNPFPSSEFSVTCANHPHHGVPIGAAQLMAKRFMESV